MSTFIESENLKETSSAPKKCDNKKHKDNITISGISNDLSKINYWKAPPSDSSEYESDSNLSLSYSSEDVSHALYDRLADKFYGIPNFNAGLHWTNVQIAGNWGSHAYEYSCWEDDERPVVKMRSYANLHLTEEEQNGVLTDRIIATCSTYLDRSPETEEYAMCKCVLSDKNICEISALKNFHYLQYLDISKNRITTLDSLGELPFLMYLDASSNLLTEVLDFKAPFNLMFANLSYNDIRTIKDLSDFWSLIVLDLSHNEIDVISGLQKLRHLRELNLCFNWIAKFEGLDNLDRIQCLNLYNNVIDNFETGPNVGLKTMTRLKKLSLARNLLSSLQIIEEARFLEVLDVSDNRIEDLLELVYLECLTRLHDLDMRENPIRYSSRYFDTCVNYTKNIFILDGEEVTAEAKVLCRKKFDKTIYEYVKARTQHMLLNYVNFPYITKSVIPYTDPPRPMIVLVGPPSCLKGLLVDVFCEIYPHYVSRGVSHTTRSRSEGEIDGEQYRFVTYDTFKGMMRKGLFYITSEYFGHLYGFAQSELADNYPSRSVLILHTDLNGALLLRSRGLRPTLVLTIPRSEEMHRRYLRRKYFCHSLQSGFLEVGLTCKKTYGGLTRMKNYNHRSIVNAVKDMLAEVCQHAYEDSSLGEVRNLDMSIYGGLTLRNFLTGKEDIDVLHSDLNYEICDKQEPVHIFMKLHHSRDQKIFCLQSKDEAQLKALNSFGIDNMIRGQLFDDIADTKEPLAEATKSSGDESSPTEEYPVITELPHLQRLFDEVIASRKTYLELHWANPGLFSQVLFTDQLDYGLDVLTEVLKSCIQTYHLRSPVCTTKDPSKSHPLVQKRIQQLRSMMSMQGVIENEKKKCHQQQLGFQNVEGKSYFTDK